MHRPDASDPVRIWRPATEYGDSCQVPAFPTGIRALPGRIGRFLLESRVSYLGPAFPPAFFSSPARICRNRQCFSRFLSGFGKTSGASLISCQDLTKPPRVLPFPTGIRQNRWRFRRFPAGFGGTTRTSVISCQDSANTAGLFNGMCWHAFENTRKLDYCRLFIYRITP
jgi:hypothetical protein